MRLEVAAENGDGGAKKRQRAVTRAKAKEKRMTGTRRDTGRTAREHRRRMSALPGFLICTVRSENSLTKPRAS